MTKITMSCLILMVLFFLYPFAVLANEAEHTIKFAYVEAAKDTSPEHIGATAFKQAVEILSNGKIEVVLYGGGILGDTESFIEQVQEGVIQMAHVAGAKLSGFYPPIQVFSIPYMFKTHTIAYDVLDSEFADNMFEDMADKTGLRIVMRGENGGFRSFTNSVRPIKNPGDMKGLKFRVMNIPLLVKMTEALGASATPMGITEVYTSLQTGLIDGQENAPLITRIWGFQEVQNYYILDKHLYSTTFQVINEDFFQNLPHDMKNAVLEAGRIATIIERGRVRELEASTLEFLKEKGMDIYSPTTEELNEFKQKTQPVIIEWLKDQVDERWITNILEATKQAENDLLF